MGIMLMKPTGTDLLGTLGDHADTGLTEGLGLGAENAAVTLTDVYSGLAIGGAAGVGGMTLLSLGTEGIGTKTKFFLGLACLALLAAGLFASGCMDSILGHHFEFNEFGVDTSSPGIWSEWIPLGLALGGSGVGGLCMLSLMFSPEPSKTVTYMPPGAHAA